MFSSAYGVVIVAEKGQNSSWDRVPSQDQYRSEEQWQVYRSSLTRILQSKRQYHTFSAPTSMQLEKHPLRRIVSFSYLGSFAPFGPSNYTPGMEAKIASAPYGIRILEATYGWNNLWEDLKLPAVYPLCRGNFTGYLGHLIDGSDGVEWIVDFMALGDPAPQLGKDLHVLYYYAEDPLRKLREIYIGAEAHGKTLFIPPFEKARKTA